MKLKPVVASLVMLGLMTPAFAKGTLLSQQAVIDQNSVITPLCAEGWFNRIQFGGVGSIVGVVGNHDPAGMFTPMHNSSDLYVNNFNLLMNANLSSWSKATFNLAYLGFPNPWGHLYSSDGDGGGSYAVKRDIDHRIVADEAYVTIGNLAKYPFYLIFGKKYVPFGDYVDPHAPYQIMSPAQMLAQTNAVTAIAGVSSDFGFYANLFGFRGETSPTGSNTGNLRNFGAKIGYYAHLDEFNVPNAHVNAALSYMHNLWDSQVFSPNATPQWTWFESASSSKLNHPASDYKIDPVGGISAHADLAYKAFSMSINWVGALKKMATSSYSPLKYESSKLWGADVNADYAFTTLERNSHLGATIQWTGNGSWMGNTSPGGATDWARVMPKWRLLGEYKVNLFKNTDLNLVVAHGKSYDFVAEASQPAEGRTTTLGLARLIVQL